MGHPAPRPLVGDTRLPAALPSRCSLTCVYVSLMKKSTSAMMKMEMGTPKSPIKRRTWGDTVIPLNPPVSPPSRGDPRLPCPRRQRALAKTSAGACNEFARSQPAPFRRPHPPSPHFAPSAVPGSSGRTMTMGTPLCSSPSSPCQAGKCYS